MSYMMKSSQNNIYIILLVYGNKIVASADESRHIKPISKSTVKKKCKHPRTNRKNCFFSIYNKMVVLVILIIAI